MKADELKNILISRTSNIENGAYSDFHFGEFVDAPNNRGVFQLNDKWFLYETDERNVMSISGPFNDSEVVYACSLYLNIAEYYEDYEFDDKALNIFIHTHYRSLKEAQEVFEKK